MNIVQITPGAGGMYCGNCFRDNALVAALRKMGHATLMVPLYLPMTLDEEDNSRGTPIFFGGVNVYLEQKASFFRSAPHWLHELLDSPRLLRWAAGRAAKTRAEEVGELTISMLKGEEGNQARELEELIAWLKSRDHPDVICLSNALLLGMARRLRSELNSTVVCMLQGEDSFLDSMPEPARGLAWKTMSERARDVDAFIAPSRYFGDLMQRRLNLPKERLHVVHNGINLEGYHPGAITVDPPVLGFFARLCREKGLDTLVEAFLILKTRNRVPSLKLHIGGGCGPGDEPFVNELRARLHSRGWLGDVEFHPNLTREQKLEFLRSLTVLSVPALYGEAFGLYLLEAMASGVPVVQPEVAAFPELIEATGGGLLCAPNDPSALADAVEKILLQADTARALRENGRKAVLAQYSVEAMTANIVKVFETVRAHRQP